MWWCTKNDKYEVCVKPSKTLRMSKLVKNSTNVLIVFTELERRIMMP